MDFGIMSIDDMDNMGDMDDMDELLFEDSGLGNLLECNLSKDISKDFYARYAETKGIKIEDNVVEQVHLCESYIKKSVEDLVEYVDIVMEEIDTFNKMNIKSYEYESIILTITQLYDRVNHQFEEYYELYDTYKLYTYTGHYKSIVYSYDKLILSYKTQFDSYVASINHYLIVLD